MGLAQIILGLVQLAGVLAQWGHARNLLDAGRQGAIADALQASLDGIRRAKAARARAAADADRVPDKQPLPDDGFRRRD
jgi:hypothetical protein